MEIKIEVTQLKGLTNNLQIINNNSIYLRIVILKKKLIESIRTQRLINLVNNILKYIYKSKI